MSFGDLYMQEDLSRKTALGPLSYAPNKQTNDNKWFYLQHLWKLTQDGAQDPLPEDWAEWPK
jgi:hypothetical protein